MATSIHRRAGPRCPRDRPTVCQWPARHHIVARAQLCCRATTPQAIATTATRGGRSMRQSPCASRLADVESVNERKATAHSMCRWLCVVTLYSVACAALRYFLLRPCINEQYDRDTVHWVMEPAPVWARHTVLMTAVAHRGRTLVCLTSRGSRIVEEVCNRGGRSDGTIKHN